MRYVKKVLIPLFAVACGIIVWGAFFVDRHWYYSEIIPTEEGIRRFFKVHGVPFRGASVCSADDGGYIVYVNLGDYDGDYSRLIGQIPYVVLCGGGCRTFDLANIGTCHNLNGLDIRYGTFKNVHCLKSHNFLNLCGFIDRPFKDEWLQNESKNWQLSILVTEKNISEIIDCRNPDSYSLIIPPGLYGLLNPTQLKALKGKKFRSINYRRTDVFWKSPYFPKGAKGLRWEDFPCDF